MIDLDVAYLKSPPIDVDSLRLAVHRAIRLNGGLTDNELYEMFPNRLQGTVRARRIELTRAGRVRPMPGVKINGRTVWQDAE